MPIRGVAGDQQAATVGQACFRAGHGEIDLWHRLLRRCSTPATRLSRRENRLLTTIAYQLDGRETYALEGAIFIAGAAVQWLRDGLSSSTRAAETGALAAAPIRRRRSILVPAFTGLGAPYWDPEARGALFGLTRATGPARDRARRRWKPSATRRAIFWTRCARDWKGGGETVLRVDGGMVASDWTMQRLADILDAPVDRPEIWRRPRSAPPGSPGRRPASGRTRTDLKRHGGATAASSPAWTIRHAGNSSQRGARR